MGPGCVETRILNLSRPLRIVLLPILGALFFCSYLEIICHSCYDSIALLPVKYYICCGYDGLLDGLLDGLWTSFEQISYRVCSSRSIIELESEFYSSHRESSTVLSELQHRDGLIHVKIFTIRQFDVLWTKKGAEIVNKSFPKIWRAISRS